MTGDVVTSYDEAAKLIRIRGKGIWSQQTIDRHFHELRSIIAQARAETGNVGVLSDLRDAAVQVPAIAEAIAGFTSDLFAPDDRIAIVVSSSIVKMQMRRIVQHDNTELFISPSAAETWVLAYRQGFLAAC